MDHHHAKERLHDMKKINPEILAEWESYRGKTIQTATGVTFDMTDLAQRAYSAAEGNCQDFQDCIDKLEGFTSEEERFRGETPHSLECGIIIARLKAELFKTKCLAYLEHKYLMGIETPNVADWLDTIAFFSGRARRTDTSVPLNDNTENAGGKKQRRKKAGKAA